MYLWNKIGYLDESDCDFSNYNHRIGVYKAILNGQIVYIGKATEYYNGGFRKRLRDYTRISESARKSKSGELMNKYRKDIVIEIIFVDSHQNGILQANTIEKNFINQYKPLWNMQ